MANMSYNVAQKEKIMAANSVVRARIDEHIKDEACAVLAAMGLSPSDAIRLLMVRIAHDKALPFEPLIPNTETVKAMRQARKGKLTSFADVDELMAHLNEKN
jgi:DNA-damage-inducible protein J